MILPLALAIIRIKRRTGKSIHEIIARLLDEIDPQIVALLQPYNLDYYSYTLTRNSYYDLSSTLEIIKYFLVNGTSKFHNQLVFTFLAVGCVTSHSVGGRTLQVGRCHIICCCCCCGCCHLKGRCASCVACTWPLHCTTAALTHTALPGGAAGHRVT